MATIRFLNNGPIFVDGLDTVTSSDGNQIKPKNPGMALCRCGASANKPFCDGSHKAIGFDSTNESASKAIQIYEYKGDALNVHYNKLLCAHNGYCVRNEPAVFDTKKRPWIQPENGEVESVLDVVKNCPTGALSYSQAEGEKQHIVADGVEIKVIKNGPFNVRNIAIEDEAVSFSEGASKEKYALCRCGLSSNKPFCDGAHLDAKWRDS